MDLILLSVYLLTNICISIGGMTPKTIIISSETSRWIHQSATPTLKGHLTETTSNVELQTPYVIVQTATQTQQSRTKSSKFSSISTLSTSVHRILPSKSTTYQLKSTQLMDDNSMDTYSVPSVPSQSADSSVAVFSESKTRVSKLQITDVIFRRESRKTNSADVNSEEKHTELTSSSTAASGFEILMASNFSTSEIADWFESGGGGMFKSDSGGIREDPNTFQGVSSSSFATTSSQISSNNPPNFETASTKTDQTNQLYYVTIFDDDSEFAKYSNDKSSSSSSTNIRVKDIFSDSTFNSKSTTSNVQAPVYKSDNNPLELKNAESSSINSQLTLDKKTKSSVLESRFSVDSGLKSDGFTSSFTESYTPSPAIVETQSDTSVDVMSPASSLHTSMVPLKVSSLSLETSIVTSTTFQDTTETTYRILTIPELLKLNRVSFTSSRANSEATSHIQSTLSSPSTELERNLSSTSTHGFDINPTKTGRESERLSSIHSRVREFSASRDVPTMSQIVESGIYSENVQSHVLPENLELSNEDSNTVFMQSSEVYSENDPPYISTDGSKISRIMSNTASVQPPMEYPENFPSEISIEEWKMSSSVSITMSIHSFEKYSENVPSYMSAEDSTMSSGVSNTASMQSFEEYSENIPSYASTEDSKISSETSNMAPMQSSRQYFENLTSSVSTEDWKMSSGVSNTASMHSSGYYSENVSSYVSTGDSKIPGGVSNTAKSFVTYSENAPSYMSSEDSERTSKVSNTASMQSSEQYSMTVLSYESTDDLKMASDSSNSISMQTTEAYSEDVPSYVSTETSKMSNEVSKIENVLSYMPTEESSKYSNTVSIPSSEQYSDVDLSSDFESYDEKIEHTSSVLKRQTSTPIMSASSHVPSLSYEQSSQSRVETFLQFPSISISVKLSNRKDSISKFSSPLNIPSMAIGSVHTNVMNEILPSISTRDFEISTVQENRFSTTLSKSFEGSRQYFNRGTAQLPHTFSTLTPSSTQKPEITAFKTSNSNSKDSQTPVISVSYSISSLEMYPSNSESHVTSPESYESKLSLASTSAYQNTEHLSLKDDKYQVSSSTVADDPFVQSDGNTLPKQTQTPFFTQRFHSQAPSTDESDSLLAYQNSMSSAITFNMFPSLYPTLSPDVVMQSVSGSYRSNRQKHTSDPFDTFMESGLESGFTKTTPIDKEESSLGKTYDYEKTLISSTSIQISSVGDSDTLSIFTPEVNDSDIITSTEQNMNRSQDFIKKASYLTSPSTNMPSFKGSKETATVLTSSETNQQAQIEQTSDNYVGVTLMESIYASGPSILSNVSGASASSSAASDFMSKTYFNSHVSENYVPRSRSRVSGISPSTRVHSTLGPSSVNVTLLLATVGSSSVGYAYPSSSNIKIRTVSTDSFMAENSALRSSAGMSDSNHTRSDTLHKTPDGVSTSFIQTPYIPSHILSSEMNVISTTVSNVRSTMLYEDSLSFNQHSRSTMPNIDLLSFSQNSRTTMLSKDSVKSSLNSRLSLVVSEVSPSFSHDKSGMSEFSSNESRFSAVSEFLSTVTKSSDVYMTPSSEVTSKEDTNSIISQIYVSRLRSRLHNSSLPSTAHSGTSAPILYTSSVTMAVLSNPLVTVRSSSVDRVHTSKSFHETETISSDNFLTESESSYLGQATGVNNQVNESLHGRSKLVSVPPDSALDITSRIASLEVDAKSVSPGQSVSTALFEDSLSPSRYVESTVYRATTYGTSTKQGDEDNVSDYILKWVFDPKGQDITSKEFIAKIIKGLEITYEVGFKSQRNVRVRRNTDDTKDISIKVHNTKPLADGTVELEFSVSRKGIPIKASDAAVVFNEVSLEVLEDNTGVQSVDNTRITPLQKVASSRLHTTPATYTTTERIPITDRQDDSSNITTKQRADETRSHISVVVSKSGDVLRLEPSSTVYVNDVSDTATMSNEGTNFLSASIYHGTPFLDLSSTSKTTTSPVISNLITSEGLPFASHTNVPTLYDTDSPKLSPSLWDSTDVSVTFSSVQYTSSISQEEIISFPTTHYSSITANSDFSIEKLVLLNYTLSRYNSAMSSSQSSFPNAPAARDYRDTSSLVHSASTLMSLIGLLSESLTVSVSQYEEILVPSLTSVSATLSTKTDPYISGDIQSMASLVWNTKRSVSESNLLTLSWMSPVTDSFKTLSESDQMHWKGETISPSTSFRSADKSGSTSSHTMRRSRVSLYPSVSASTTENWDTSMSVYSGISTQRMYAQLSSDTDLTIHNSTSETAESTHVLTTATASEQRLSTSVRISADQVGTITSYMITATRIPSSVSSATQNITHWSSVNGTERLLKPDMTISTNHTVSSSNPSVFQNVSISVTTMPSDSYSDTKFSEFESFIISSASQSSAHPPSHILLTSSSDLFARESLSEQITVVFPSVKTSSGISGLTPSAHYFTQMTASYTRTGLEEEQRREPSLTSIDTYYPSTRTVATSVSSGRSERIQTERSGLFSSTQLPLRDHSTLFGSSVPVLNPSMMSQRRTDMFTSIVSTPTTQLSEPQHISSSLFESPLSTLISSRISKSGIEILMSTRSRSSARSISSNKEPSIQRNFFYSSSETVTSSSDKSTHADLLSSEPTASMTSNTLGTTTDIPIPIATRVYLTTVPSFSVDETMNERLSPTVSPTSFSVPTFTTVATESVSSTPSSIPTFTTAPTQSVPPTSSSLATFTTAATESVPPTSSSVLHFTTTATESLLPTTFSVPTFKTAATESVPPTSSPLATFTTAATESVSSTSSSIATFTTAATESVPPTSSSLATFTTAATESVPPTSSSVPPFTIAATESLLPTSFSVSTFKTAATESVSLTSSSTLTFTTTATESVPPTSSSVPPFTTAATESTTAPSGPPVESLMILIMKIDLGVNITSQAFTDQLEKDLITLYNVALEQRQKRSLKRVPLLRFRRQTGVDAEVVSSERDAHADVKVTTSFAVTDGGAFVDADVAVPVFNRIHEKQASAILSYEVLGPIRAAQTLVEPPAEDNSINFLIIVAIVVPATLLLLGILFIVARMRRKRGVNAVGDLPPRYQRGETLEDHNLTVDVEKGEIVDKTPTSTPSLVQRSSVCTERKVPLIGGVSALGVGDEDDDEDSHKYRDLTETEYPEDLMLVGQEKGSHRSLILREKELLEKLGVHDVQKTTDTDDLTLELPKRMKSKKTKGGGGPSGYNTVGSECPLLSSTGSMTTVSSIDSDVHTDASDEFTVIIRNTSSPKIKEKHCKESVPDNLTSVGVQASTTTTPTLQSASVGVQASTLTTPSLPLASIGIQATDLSSSKTDTATRSVDTQTSKDSSATSDSDLSSPDEKKDVAVAVVTDNVDLSSKKENKMVQTPWAMKRRSDTRDIYIDDDDLRSPNTPVNTRLSISAGPGETGQFLFPVTESLTRAYNLAIQGSEQDAARPESQQLIPEEVDQPNQTILDSPSISSIDSDSDLTVSSDHISLEDDSFEDAILAMGPLQMAQQSEVTTSWSRKCSGQSFKYPAEEGEPPREYMQMFPSASSVIPVATRDAPRPKPRNVPPRQNVLTKEELAAQIEQETIAEEVEASRRKDETTRRAKKLLDQTHALGCASDLQSLSPSDMMERIREELKQNEGSMVPSHVQKIASQQPKAATKTRIKHSVSFVPSKSDSNQTSDTSGSVCSGTSGSSSGASGCDTTDSTAALLERVKGELQRIDSKGSEKKPDIHRAKSRKKGKHPSKS